MNVDRPSEHDEYRKLYLELEMQSLARSIIASSAVLLVSAFFFAGQYFRVAVQKVPQSDTGRWIFLVSGLMAFGMIFWTSSKLATWWRMKRELSRLERAEKKLIA